MGRGWSKPTRSDITKSKRDTVKLVKLNRTSIQYVLGATLRPNFAEWRDDPKINRGVPSTLEEIPCPQIRYGTDPDGEAFTEITVPDSFDPGSILVFATENTVSVQLCRISRLLSHFYRKSVRILTRSVNST